MEDDFLSIILPDNRNNMFDTLRSNSLQLLPKIRNLVEVKNDLIFAYDPIHQSILVTRASSFLKQASEKYQIYSPTVTIYGDADLMRVNENTTKAVIRTDQCLFVMDLPHVYLCCMLPPTATNMTKTRLWLVRPHGAEDPAFTRVLQVRWHPLQPYQLLVLYNDNRLRLMDAQCQTILNILSLGRRPTSNPLSTVIPLGEHAVDFAFVWRVNENLNDEMETEQQIMLVRGNGDIFNAEITPDRAIKEHPLTISSGTTAFISENWSIMVMPCYPPIVVIVSDDFIYHFVLFESGNMKYLQMVEAIQKWESPPGECSGRGCTDYIVKDTASMSRYFIVSHAGILTVIIPTLDSFTDFWKGYPEVATPGQESTKELLTKNTSKMEMVTSKDLGEPSHLHLFGLGLISGHRFTTHIVTVLPNLETVTLSIENLFQFVPTVESCSSFQHIPRDDLSDVWMEMQADLSSVVRPIEYVRNDSYEEVMNQVAFCKERVLQHNNILAANIEKNLLALEVKLNRQEQHMMILKSEKEVLKSGAERIAELYEEINENQSELLLRFQKIALNITAPIMSLAEKKMREDVIRFRKTTEDLVKEIKKVENEIAYMIKEHISVQTTCLPHKQAYLPEQKRKILQEELKKMTARIASMKANINRLNDIIKACHDVSLN